MQDRTAHFMEIVEEMAVDPIGPRAQGHATNGGAGPVIRIEWKVELPGSHGKGADLPAQVQDSRGLSSALSINAPLCETRRSLRQEGDRKSTRLNSSH